MILVDDLSENVAILLQHDCDLDVSVHVHVRGVAHGFGLQTQGDCRRMVGVDGQVLQIRDVENSGSCSNYPKSVLSHCQRFILHCKKGQEEEEAGGKEAREGGE